MTIVSIRRKLFLLVMVVGLITPGATASAAGLPRESPQPSSIVVESIGRLWRVVQGVFGKIGCHIDPDGRCVEPAPAPQSKAGCHIDPSGVCVP